LSQWFTVWRLYLFNQTKTTAQSSMHCHQQHVWLICCLLQS